MSDQLPLLPSTIAFTKEANPRRGVNHKDAAKLFSKRFGIGSRFTNDSFDSWAFENSLLDRPLDRDKKSPGWMAHVQKRCALRDNIRTAGTHPRMGDLAFTLESQGGNWWQVMSPADTVIGTQIVERIESSINTKFASIEHAIQAIDLKNVNPIEWRFLLMRWQGLDRLREDILKNCERLTSDAEMIRRDLEGYSKRLPDDLDLAIIERGSDA
jgi:hypothetical protein